MVEQLVVCGVGVWAGPPIPANPSSVLKTPASDLKRPSETFRSLLGGELEMRFGGNPIEGSNPSLSATPSRTKRHHPGGGLVQRYE